MTVGDRIRRKREELGITQIDLAKSFNASKQTLYKYENNIVTNIPLNNIEMIAKKLRVSPGYLMGWEDDFSIETAKTDVALSNMEKRVKAYALKLAALPKEKQEQIMNLIDMLEG